MKRLVILLFLFSLVCFPSIIWAQDREEEEIEVTTSAEMMDVLKEGRVPNYLFSIGVRGGYYLPANNIAELIEPFFCTSLYFRYNPDDLFKLFAGDVLQGLIFELDLTFTPTTIKKSPDSTLYLFETTFGLRYGIPLGSLFTLVLYTNYGANFSLFSGEKTNVDANYTSFMFKGGVDLEFELAYHSELSIGINYRTPFDSAGVQGFTFYASYSYRIGGEPRENQLRVTNPSLDAIFPSLNSTYSTKQNIGTVAITNTGDEPIDNIQVAVYVDGFMNSPSQTPEAFELAPEENLIVPLFAVFNKNILENNSDQLVNTEIVVRYSIEGSTYTKRESSALMVYNKNALIWEPVERVASFCSPDDPAIQLVRSSVETNIQDQENTQFISTNMRRAMRAFELLKSYNLEYLPDPNKPFALSEGGTALAVDTIQFPSEFLQENRRTGDCDDCSVLYTSLLESFGVPSAFLLTPNHIFTMFNTGVPEQSVSMITEDRSSVIIYEGEVWIPVEATFLDKDKPGFLEAWEIGMEEYETNSDQLYIVPIEETWQVYPYVVIDTDVSNIASPDIQSANQAYNQAVIAYRSNHRSNLDRALSNDAATMTPAEKRQAAVALIQNGQSSDAIPILESITGDGENEFEDHFYLATAYFHGAKDYQQAIGFYEQASQYLSNQELTVRYLPRIYLNIAQCYNKLGSIQQQIEYYRRASELNPALAHRMAYLGETSTEGTAVAADVTQETILLLLD